MDGYNQLTIEAIGAQTEVGEPMWRHGDVATYLHRMGPNDIRDEGNYLTVHAPDEPWQQADAHLSEATTQALRWLMAQSKMAHGPTLAVGLGNAGKLCDALGTYTLDRLEGSDSLKLFYPHVQQHTGLSSGDSAATIADLVRASCLVVVDTLVCASPRHLCRTVQLSDAGIRPGGGLGYGRKALSRQTVGVPVFYIGIPLLAFVDPYDHRHCVTPQNLADVVQYFATMLAASIHAATIG